MSDFANIKAVSYTHLVNLFWRPYSVTVLLKLWLFLPHCGFL